MGLNETILNDGKDGLLVVYLKKDTISLTRRYVGYDDKKNETLEEKDILELLKDGAKYRLMKKSKEYLSEKPNL